MSSFASSLRTLLVTFSVVESSSVASSRARFFFVVLLLLHFSTSSVVRVLGVVFDVVGAVVGGVCSNDVCSQPSFLKIELAESPPNFFSNAVPFMVLSRRVIFSTGIRHHLQPYENEDENENENKVGICEWRC